MKRPLLLLGFGLFLASCAGNPPQSSASFSSSAQTSESSSAQESSSVSSVSSDISSSSASSPSSVSSDSSSSVSSSLPAQKDPMGEPYVGRQYYLNHIGDIYSAWDHYRGKGITIAVIDVGFNPYHEDFTYEDGTSKVSAKSASFVTNQGKTTTTVGLKAVENMGESHGTFCAGVAAAGINGKGVVGIAPDAELMLLKTDAKPLSIAQAFHYAADNGAKVVTISIGSYFDYRGDLVDDGSDLGTVFDEPVAYCYNKGIAVLSAGGNGGLDGLPNEYTFPGCVDNVIGVGGLAANSSTEIWEGSSYNSSSKYQSIDVFAPADMMFGCCHYDGKTHDGGWNGTSFASPIVAGMAALYFEANPTKGARDFESALYASCHPLTQSSIATADQLGYGRVDIGKLLGLTSSGTVKAKVAVGWDSCYAYCWNSVTGVQQKAWPGTALSKEDGAYVVTIDQSKYDSVIFAQSSSGPQTVDLSASSFHNGATLNLVGAVKEVGCLVGTYRV